MNTDHIPYNMPTRGWTLSQNWVNLTFMHWEVEHTLLRRYIPEDLELETFNGKTYVGTIPFRMEKVRPRYLPSVPLISNFPEFNIRTYVSKNGVSGVLFLTLDAESRITSMYAPWAYGLPYVFAKGEVKKNSEGGFSWHSKRKSNGIGIIGKSKPSGDIRKADKNSIEEFLFERYCLYVTYKGKTHIAYTYHKKWEFQNATVIIEENSLTDFYKLGISNLLQPDLVHISKGVEVKTWNVEVA